MGKNLDKNETVETENNELENIEIVQQPQLPIKILLDIVFKNDDIQKIIIIFHEMINETFGNTTEAFMVPQLNQNFFDDQIVLNKYCYAGHKTSFVGEIELGDISKVTKSEFLEILDNISFENVLVFSEEQLFLTKKLLNNPIVNFNFKEE
jgi:hypothetical protein